MFVERNSCAICGCDNTTIIYKSDYTSPEITEYLFKYYGLQEVITDEEYTARFSGKPYAVMRCGSCRGQTQKLAPDQEFAEEVYNIWIGKNQNSKKAVPLSEFSHQINQALALVSFLLNHQGKESPSELKVLDYGLGWGRFALAMKACGCEVFGFDLSDERQKLAETNGIRTLTYDMISQHRFDFINTEQVFEHLTEPLRECIHLSSSLAKNGVLKISVPYARWAEGEPFKIDWKAKRYGRWSPMPLAPLEHLNYFRRPSMEVMAAKCGLSRVQFPKRDQFNYMFDWGGLRQIGKNLSRPFLMSYFRNYYLFSAG